MKHLPTFVLACGLALGLLSCRDTAGEDPSRAAFCVDLETAVSQAPPFRELRYIPLETRDSVLVGAVDKVVYRNHRFYLLDKRQNRIWVFSDSGDYLSAISKAGSGPGEYIRAMDMDVDSAGNVYVADVHRQRIVVYEAPHYKSYRSIEVGEVFEQFAVCDSGFVYLSGLSSRPGGLQVRLASHASAEGQTVVLQEDLYEGTHRFPKPPPFRRSGNTVLYARPFDFRVMDVGTRRPRPLLDIRSDRLPSESTVQRWIKEGPQAMQHDDEHLYSVYACYATDDCLLVTLQASPAVPHFVLVDKQSHATYAFASYGQHRMAGNLNPCAADGRYFVTATFPRRELIEAVVADPALDEASRKRLSTLSEDDNPVMTLFNFALD